MTKKDLVHGPEDRLRQNLTKLGLTRILEIYPDLITKAKQEELTHLETLDRLVEEEARTRFERLVARRIREARIPVMKSLDSFDFKFPKKIKRELVVSLFDLDFVAKKTNVIFLGRTGIGKTHLATALALACCQKGYRVLFSTAVNVVNHLQAAQSDGTFLRRLRHYLVPDLLVLDELGYLPIDRHGADLLFQVISGRYERGSVVLTTNRAFKEWASVFNDATVAAAVIDRLAHHSEVIVIEGKSHRLPEGDTPEEA
jgi:DNA replication protein DnaC